MNSPALRVETGVPNLWDSCTATTGVGSEIHCAIWSPCGQFVAIGLKDVIDVRDSSTLERSYTLKLPSGAVCIPYSLAFSPDGHLLACHFQQ